jgi:hypothetical protein
MGLFIKRTVMRKDFALFLCCLLPIAAGGQVVVEKPLSPRLTGYDIDAVLDPEEHTVNGRMTAFWVNHSSAR